ncbi:MAG TPA: gamma-glutamylcyclotransferase [Candidatus Caldiarchaeum subterraneum]|uniref:Gamma-glutamylcyclotransferase n=1 Tax=Caldiarchaeum subterraneum TaxID=311458 RepID=A0A832ZVF9_CALS0|nr:gamma-glutamylcyclotransferase [Candidatus Caldarchaeum subterraneum]
MEVWYFAYGVNLDKEVMRRRVGEWIEAKRAILRNYELRFNTYSPTWRGGTASIVEKEGAVVYGVAYLISEEQMKALDKHVGVPNRYSRIKVKVETEDGDELPAMTHVSNNPKYHIHPSQQYLASLLRGLKQHGYQEEVIKTVKKVAGIE